MAIDPTSKIFKWTPMIRMSDMKYPVYLSDFLKEHTNVTIGDFVWEYEMAGIWNYFKVYDSETPVGDVVTEGEPAYDDVAEQWVKTWTARDFTPEEVADNLSRAKDDARNLAAQVLSGDMQSGVKVGADTFGVEPREAANLDCTRAFAVANPDADILLKKTDHSLISLPSAQAVEKIDAILAQAGKVNQNYLAYLKSVFDTTVITDIPEVPGSFVGE